MTRGGLKVAVATLLGASGTARLLGRLGSAGRMPKVLGYHRVVEDFAALAPRTIAPLLIDARTFAAHLDWIARRLRLVPLDEIVRRLSAGEPCGDLAAITFDDGYRDTFEVAFPVLRARGVPATVFVVPGLLDTDELHVHDRLYLAVARAFAAWRRPHEALGRLLDRLDVRVPLPGDRAATPFAVMRALFTALPQRRLLEVIAAVEGEVGRDDRAYREHRLLTWDMLAAMARAGVGVGSHTQSHARLGTETPERARAELVESRTQLERRLGLRVAYLSYPDGQFDDTVVAAAEAAGYRAAFTTCAHVDPQRPLLTIPRRLLWEGSCADGAGRFSPAVMHGQVHGVFDRAGRCRARHRREAP